MKILALDLGSTTGWAFVEDDKVLNFGEQYFPGDRPARLFKFHDWYHRKIHEFTPEVVIFERPFCRGLHATRSLWGAAGIVEAETYGQGLPSLDIVPSTLKKWATGSGRASKDDMIVAAETLIDYSVSEVLGEHEADAIILGLYAAENIEPGE